MRLALRAILRQAAMLAGATFAASLESKLSDSACSVICAAACFASNGAVQIATSTTKRKTTKWWSFFLAEKERFELSRRYNRPTPLAGAPLRPLEYFSVYSSQAAFAETCDTPIIYDFFAFVNIFFNFYFVFFLLLFENEAIPDRLFGAIGYLWSVCVST